jgi:hypothetical protein
MFSVCNRLRWQRFASSNTAMENQNEDIASYGDVLAGPTYCRLQDHRCGTPGPWGPRGPQGQQGQQAGQTAQSGQQGQSGQIRGDGPDWPAEGLSVQVAPCPVGEHRYTSLMLGQRIASGINDLTGNFCVQFTGEICTVCSNSRISRMHSGHVDLSTHSAGGLTKNDFKLARKIQKIYGH